MLQIVAEGSGNAHKATKCQGKLVGIVAGTRLEACRATKWQDFVAGNWKTVQNAEGIENFWTWEGKNRHETGFHVQNIKNEY